jgi:hypothetical protein
MQTKWCKLACSPATAPEKGACWRIKDVSTYDPQAYGPTPFSPWNSQGSCQSAEQGDYKRLIYLYSLTTQTLTMIRLENDYTTLERERLSRLDMKETLAHGSTILEHATALNMKTDLIYRGLWPRFRPFPPPRTVTTWRYSWLDLWWTRRIEWIQGSMELYFPLRHGS